MKRSIQLLAALGILIALPAQACQLVCMYTTRTYNGNLGGLTGANAKCNDEFPGFKLAPSRRILDNITGPGAGAVGSTTTTTTNQTYNVQTYTATAPSTGFAASPTSSTSTSTTTLSPPPGGAAPNAWAGKYIDAAGTLSCASGGAPWSTGGFVNGSVTQNGPGYTEMCNAALPLLCCNM